MLISFSVENWMSFRDKATLSMVASRERQHKSHVPLLKPYKTKILPITAMYGGNASGKSNLFAALSFIKALVVIGTTPDGRIPVEPFRLSDTTTTLPSIFCIELLSDGTIYEFSFAVTSKKVVEEKLVEITPHTETVLYHRYNDEPHFCKSLDKDNFMHFAFRGTRDNQLFLTNAVSQKVDTFRPVYDWFENNLTLVAPNSQFMPIERFINEDDPLYITMTDMLSQLDTGIAHLGSENVPLETVPLSADIKKVLLEHVSDNSTARFNDNDTKSRYLFTMSNDRLGVRKLIAYHNTADGADIAFDMRQESDGTIRVIDLLPAFVELSAPGSSKVYIVDELDRSLHTLLVRQLLAYFLHNCSEETRSQLLFTTHDALLIDQSLLRRDEIWVVERDHTGNSSLIAFADFKDVRNDKDIRKSYLQGRMGGIPRIALHPTDSRQRSDSKEDGAVE